MTGDVRGEAMNSKTQAGLNTNRWKKTARQEDEKQEEKS